MLVPAFLASTFASPVAFGASLVPTKTTFVDPPPTSYPTALMDLRTTSASGVDGSFCAIAMQLKMGIHTKHNKFFEANFIGILRLVCVPIRVRAGRDWQRSDSTPDSPIVAVFRRRPQGPVWGPSLRRRALRSPASIGAGLEFVGEPKNTEWPHLRLKCVGFPGWVVLQDRFGFFRRAGFKDNHGGVVPVVAVHASRDDGASRFELLGPICGMAFKRFVGFGVVRPDAGLFPFRVDVP